MPLALQSLDGVDQTTFDNALQLIEQMLSDSNPDLDLRRGPFYDLVVYVAARLAAVNQDNCDRVRRSNSLQAVIADPTLADDDTLDRLASNYNVTRSAGTAATGSAVLILTSLVDTVIPSGQQFTDPTGQVFTADSAFIGRASSSDVITTSDRLISAVGDGTYSFTITLTAEAVGTSYNIVRGTTLTPATTLSSVFSRAYAGSDFTGGADAETNTSLANRIQTSWAAQSLDSRAGLENLLRNVTGYADLVAVSAVGYGDAEQRRNHSILPVALPGRVDAWVRTQGPYQAAAISVTATYQGTAVGGTSWRFSLTRDSAPGFYEIEKIALPANADNDAVATYTITSETRGYDLSAGATDGLTYLPDVTSVTEAAYSRYSTDQVTFTDTDTSSVGLTAGVSTKTYTVIVRMLPGIDTLQDAVAASSARSLSGDCLVRAAVPVFVTLTFDVGLTSGVTLSSSQQSALKQAAVDAINATGFLAALPATTVLTALTALLPAGASVTTLTLAGRLRRPDGTNVTLTSSSVALTPTADTTNLVSSKTVCFFARVADVTLTTSAL